MLGMLLAGLLGAGALACTPGDVPPASAAADEPFSMAVEDRFRIANGGLVATGIVETGSVSVGDRLCLRSASASPREIVVAGIESFNKLLDSASQGTRVGLLLEGVELDEISPGDQLHADCGLAQQPVTVTTDERGR